MIVYAAEFNDCIHESAYSTISLHLSEDGAKKALKKAKARILRQWKKVGFSKAPDYELYRVRVIEVLE